jgi:hypothetical protein
MEKNDSTSGKKHLKELQDLEQDFRPESFDQPANEDFENQPQPKSATIIDSNKENTVKLHTNTAVPNTTGNQLDGYYIIENHELPQEGKLYPEYWRFAYRCPTAGEVSNFSTVVDNDQSAIIQVIEDLIRKCVVIYDEKNDREIASTEILDGHRSFFLLKIREVYLPGQKLSYLSVCNYCKESYDTILTANKLSFFDIPEGLFQFYDGRVFTIPVLDNKEIKFYIPTISITSKIFKHIVKVYKNNNNDKNRTEDRTIYDKLFLLLAPFLFEHPSETIHEVRGRYQKIQKDDALLQEYLELANGLKFHNEEEFLDECPHCGSQEESAVRFPGGIQKLFIGKSSISKYIG